MLTRSLLAHWRDVAICLGAISVSIYFWFKVRFSHWSSKGIDGPPPSFPAGNIGSVFLKKKQFFQPFIECYERYRHLPYVGMFTLYNPVLLVNDVDLIKQILVKDFSHFATHGTTACPEVDPLSVHLFNLHGDKWKRLRNLITPTFSSGKMKLLFDNLLPASQEMEDYLDSAASRGSVEDLSAVFANYTLDVIGRVAFGLECNCFRDPNSTYKRNVQEFLEPSSFYWQAVRTLWFLAPELFRRLRVARIKPAVSRFFLDLVQDTARHRSAADAVAAHAAGARRNDFLQMLLDINNNFQKDDEDCSSCPGAEGGMSWSELAGNTMMYLGAGHETSATTATFAAYELAQQADALSCARAEVARVLRRHGDRFTYDALQDMTYLTLVVEETLRKHPPMRALFRRCTKDYKIPGTKTVLEKGTMVFIPVQGLQNDPDIFPEPHVFDPTRFLPENKTEKQKAVYMPFGDGPKMCLGVRFGVMSTKLALAVLLSRYTFRLHARTPLPVRYKTSSLPLAIDPGLYVTLAPLAPATASATASAGASAERRAAKDRPRERDDYISAGGGRSF